MLEVIERQMRALAWLLHAPTTPRIVARRRVTKVQ